MIALVENFPSFAASGPGDFAGKNWRAVSSTVCAGESIPGPCARPLNRLLSNRNAFARLEAATTIRIRPGERVTFSVVVARPSTLVSALVLDSEAGRPELRVRWASYPPRHWVLGANAGLQALGGGVEVVNADTYVLSLEAVNRTDRPLHARPAFHIACGIENAGLDLGMHAGAVTLGHGPRQQYFHSRAASGRGFSI